MKFIISGEISSIQKDDLIPEKFGDLSQQICQKLNNALSNNTYGEAITVLFLAPMILQNEIEFFAVKKERKLIKHKDKLADFRLRIDYQQFNHGSAVDREKLLLKNVVDSIRIIQQRLKNKFEGKELENDILDLWNLTYTDLESVNNQVPSR